MGELQVGLPAGIIIVQFQLSTYLSFWVQMGIGLGGILMCLNQAQMTCAPYLDMCKFLFITKHGHLFLLIPL